MTFDELNISPVIKKQPHPYALLAAIPPDIWLQKCLKKPTIEDLRKLLHEARSAADIVHRLRNENGVARKTCERRLRPAERPYDSTYQELLLRSRPLKDALYNRVTNVRLCEKMISNLANGKPIELDTDFIISERPYRKDISDSGMQGRVKDVLADIDFDLEERYDRFARVASFCSRQMGGKGLPLMDAVPHVNALLGINEDLKAWERWLKRYWRSEGQEEYDWTLTERCKETLLKRKERQRMIKKESS